MHAFFFSILLSRMHITIYPSYTVPSSTDHPVGTATHRLSAASVVSCVITHMYIGINSLCPPILIQSVYGILVHNTGMSVLYCRMIRPPWSPHCLILTPYLALHTITVLHQVEQPPDPGPPYRSKLTQTPRHLVSPRTYLNFQTRYRV